MDFIFGFHYFVLLEVTFFISGWAVFEYFFSILLGFPLNQHLFLRGARKFYCLSCVHRILSQRNEEFQTTTVFQAMGATIGLLLFTFFQFITSFLNTQVLVVRNFINALGFLQNT